MHTTREKIVDWLQPSRPYPGFDAPTGLLRDLELNRSLSLLLHDHCSGHLIESAQIWLSSNGVECDWLERARLVEASRVIAAREGARPFPKDDADLHKLFNLRTVWCLDYRSPVVQRIHALCSAYLKYAPDGERTK